jgi:hypothetical protein
MQPKKHEKKIQMHLCVKQKLELTEMPQSCVSICMEYGMKEQTVWDNTKTFRPSEILSFDREGTTHYAKGSPWEHTEPPKQIILNDAQTKWYKS